jgi:hypothetical protein
MEQQPESLQHQAVFSFIFLFFEFTKYRTRAAKGKTCAVFLNMHQVVQMIQQPSRIPIKEQTQNIPLPLLKNTLTLFQH